MLRCVSAMQLSSSSRICDACRRISAADCSSTAEAFKALCVSVPGYTGNGVMQATFKEGLASLQYPGAWMADGSALLTGSDLEAWRDWRRVLLRSTDELQEVIACGGAPHTEPVLNRKPQFYARLVRDMRLRGLVSFGAPSEVTVGVFVVPKKLGKQRLSQHFLRPWHCVLPAPASWAGLQLPADSSYHMAKTDVNTSFYRILAPTGMSEYYILPKVATYLLTYSLLREGGKFQIICDICPTCLRSSRFLPWASLGRFILVRRWRKVVYGHLVFRRTRCSWIVTGHLRRLGIRFVSGFTLTVSVAWAVTARKFGLPWRL